MKTTTEIEHTFEFEVNRPGLDNLLDKTRISVRAQTVRDAVVALEEKLCAAGVIGDAGLLGDGTATISRLVRIDLN